jgi:hypothetical protein
VVYRRRDGVFDRLRHAAGGVEERQGEASWGRGGLREDFVCLFYHVELGSSGIFWSFFGAWQV